MLGYYTVLIKFEPGKKDRDSHFYLPKDLKLAPYELVDKIRKWQ